LRVAHLRQKFSRTAIAILAVLPASGALAQTGTGAALWPLAQALCRSGEAGDFKGGFLPLMGFGADRHAMRKFRHGDPVRYLMIPAEQCRGGTPAKDRTALILWHILRPGEGRYYLASANGELLLAIDGTAANRANYMLADHRDPDLLADFAGEKRFWLERIVQQR